MFDSMNTDSKITSFHFKGIISGRANFTVLIIIRDSIKDRYVLPQIYLYSLIERIGILNTDPSS